MNDIEKHLKTLVTMEELILRFGLKDPSVLDDLFELTGYLVVLSEEERNDFIDFIDRKSKLKIMYLSADLAEKSVNDSDEKYLKAALLCHVVEGGDDFRENYRHLILVDYAAKQIGADLKLIYGQLKFIPKGDTKKSLDNFIIHRDPAINRLASIKIEAVHDDGVFKFVSTVKRT